MYLFTRYILWQLISIFLISISAITIVMLLFVIIRELHLQGLQFSQIYELIPYILPDALRFAIPATSLFATCLVFGRLSSSNEIIALKSLGISPWRILWPSFAAVVLLSFTTVWLNDLAVSWGRRGVQKIVLESIEEVAYSRLKNHGSHTTNQFTINVKSVEGKRLVEPTLTFKSSGNSPTVVIRAAWAELHSDVKNGSLTILMNNGSAVGGGVEGVFPDTIKRVIPLNRAARRSQDSGSPSQMALSEIPAEITKQKTRIDAFEQRLAATSAFQLALGNFHELKQTSESLDHAISGEASKLFRLHTEPHRRWAAGFSCLFFVAVGAPLAIQRRNGEFWTTFFLCFIPILLVYYPILMVSIEQAKSGDLPPSSVWLGNLALLVWSIFLIRKVLRY
ncbi:MAG: LptF/LptG family permease [Pirellulales bacterium]|jgi:lipopolysaccharide export system permease protein|nr:LptF/LptG family permease [Pirellulales bacterium]